MMMTSDQNRTLGGGGGPVIFPANKRVWSTEQKMTVKKLIAP